MGPWTALAPMQDVTTLPFMRILGRYGAPDILFTEYFRVHSHSTLEVHIVESITKNGTGRPIFAQMIGESVPDLVRTMEALQELPIAGIDLNMGCPAPKVYKKNVGGGLLRDPAKVDSILAAMRATTKGNLTVKMRIGFDDDRHFETLLALIEKHDVDLLSLHARTVKEGYRSEVHYDYIKKAVTSLSCPVLANGNITSVEKGEQVLQSTQAAGLMIGRSCIRNPWIFGQLRDHWAGREFFRPRLSDVRRYVDELYEEVTAGDIEEKFRVNKLKKFLNFVGIAVDSNGEFLHDMRRVKNYDELRSVADRHLLANGRGARVYPLEPLEGLISRPNCETPEGCSL